MIFKHATAKKIMEREKEELEEAKQNLDSAIQAQKILQQLAEQIQNQSHKQIAKIVSRCLSAVFQEPWELRIIFERKRGKTEVKFRYVRNGREEHPSVSSGGVLDVASLALRLASITLSMPQPRKLLVLDEPFRQVAKENLGRVAKLIECLANELGVQFILATHSEVLEVGKVVRL